MSKLFSWDGHSTFLSLVATNCSPHSLSETPNRTCWNTYWYWKQIECQFIPGPTDGGTEFNITSPLVRGRLRQAPTTVDPSSAMTQQPLRNSIVAYSRNSSSLSALWCKAGNNVRVVRHIERFWSRDRHDGSQARPGERCFQTATWKYEIVFIDTQTKTCHVAILQTGILLWRYLSQ